MTEQIRERAYHLWVQQGFPHGREREHWLEAERQLNAVAEEKPVKKVAARKPARTSAAEVKAPATPSAKSPSVAAAKAPAKRRKATVPA